MLFIQDDSIGLFHFELQLSRSFDQVSEDVFYDRGHAVTILVDHNPLVFVEVCGLGDSLSAKGVLVASHDLIKGDHLWGLEHIR